MKLVGSLVICRNFSRKFQETFNESTSVHVDCRGLFRGRCPFVSRVSTDQTFQREFSTYFQSRFRKSTLVEEKQKLNDRSLFRKRKNYNRKRFQLLMRSSNVFEIIIKGLLILTIDETFVKID